MICLNIYLTRDKIYLPFVEENLTDRLEEIEIKRVARKCSLALIIFLSSVFNLFSSHIPVSE